MSIMVILCVVILIPLLATSSLAPDTSITRATNVDGLPEIVYQWPKPGSTDVPIDEVIEVGFNEDMDPEITKAAFIVSKDEGGTILGFRKMAGHNIEFHPEGGLEYETTYNITVTVAAKDLTGEYLSENVSWSFTTVKGAGDNSKSDDKSNKEDWWRFWEPILTGGTIIGTFLVAAIGVLLYRRKRSELRRYIGKLDDVYEKYRRDPYVCEHKLTQLKESCKIKFKRGRMEENHYLIMDKKIDDYLQDIRYRKTLTKPKIVAGVEKEIHNELDKVAERGSKSSKRKRDFDEDDDEDDIDDIDDIDDDDRVRIKIDYADEDDEPVDIDDYEEKPKKPSKPRIVKD